MRNNNWNGIRKHKQIEQEVTGKGKGQKNKVRKENRKSSEPICMGKRSRLSPTAQDLATGT